MSELRGKEVSAKEQPPCAECNSLDPISCVECGQGILAPLKAKVADLRAQVKRWEDKEASRGHQCTLVERERDELLELLRSVEWSGDFCDEPACPLCLGREWKGHSKECRLGKALRPPVIEKGCGGKPGHPARVISADESCGSHPCRGDCSYYFCDGCADCRPGGSR